MKIAIHQPQYIPWIPYFLKIEKSDIFILLDSVDFQKNGLQNRNEIKTGQGRHWLTVPVSQKLGQKIFETKINNNLNWRKKHLQTIKNCYSKSNFYNDYINSFEKIYNQEWTSLNDLNNEIIKMMMKWLNIDVPIIKSSEINANGSGSDLILDICKKNNATEYISGIGGKNYINEESFNDAGIKINFLENRLPSSYPQLYPKVGFFNDLSAVDIIFNCGEGWKEILKFD